MSGGSLDYFYFQLQEHAGDFEDRELNELVTDLAQLFHDREWYLSGDTCEGSWKEAREKFKEKWFTEVGRTDRIEKYLSDIRHEVLESFGLSDRYCKNCANWKTDEETSPYGSCEFEKSCLMHGYESCEKFQRNQGREE